MLRDCSVAAESTSLAATLLVEDGAGEEEDVLKIQGILSLYGANSCMYDHHREVATAEITRRLTSDGASEYMEVINAARSLI